VSPKCLPFGIETKKKKEVHCTLILENKFKKWRDAISSTTQVQHQAKKKTKKKKALFDLWCTRNGSFQSIQTGLFNQHEN
jgi:hypothetical protein